MKALFADAHKRIWRSILLCGSFSACLLVGGAFTPIAPAGAENYSYSGVDRHCTSEINRSILIDIVTAAQVQSLPAFAPVADATNLTGTLVYCSFGPKSVQTPSGTMWGTVYVLPIAQTSDALIVYVDELARIIGVERWGVAPRGVMAQIHQRPLLGQWDNPPTRDRPVSRWLHERFVGSVPQPAELPSEPENIVPVAASAAAPQVEACR